MEELVTVLLPAIALWLGRYAYEGIQLLLNLIKMKLPLYVHGLALMVVNWLLLQLGQFVGMTVPAGLDGFTPELATALTLALGQMGWHHLSQKGKPKDTVEV
jgi:hypothetical protein